jgi:chaperonin GroEL
VGADGQIFIHKDVSCDTVLELINGYKFSCKIDPRFIAATKIEKWDRTAPKMFIIDGIVESVSEINRILEDASNKKYPGVLLALGFSEEVIATLSVNYLRGSLDMLPLAPIVGIENINTLTDIAVVIGADVVSSNKGDLVSSIDPEEIRHVDRVTSDLRGILIQNESTKKWISAHINHLLKKRDDEEMNDKVNLINLRLASLASKYCHIRVGKHLADELPFLAGRIESGIKIGREISKFGVIDVAAAAGDINHGVCLTMEIVKDTLRRLAHEGYDKVPASSLVLGIRSGLSCCKSIASTGCFIVSD